MGIAAKKDEAPAARLFREPKETQAVMFVLPVVLLLTKGIGFEWDATKLMIGQGIIVVEALFIIGGILLLKNKVEASKEENSKKKLIVEEMAMGIAVPDENGNPKRTDTTVFDHDLAAVKKLFMPVVIGVVIAFLLPWKWEINQPVMLQSLTMPITFIRNRLVRSYLFGDSDQSTWAIADQVTKEEAEKPKEEKKED